MYSLWMMQESGLSFTTIDSDIMALLNLPKRTLLDNSSRSILNEEAKRVKEKITNHINVALQAALELTSRYETFYYLIKEDEVQLLESLNRVSDDEYFTCVRRFHNAGNAILHLSSDHEPLKLFMVDTTSSKTVLSKRAFFLRDSLLQVRTDNNSCSTKYALLTVTTLSLAEMKKQPTLKLLHITQPCLSSLSCALFFSLS